FSNLFGVYFSRFGSMHSYCSRLVSFALRNPIPSSSPFEQLCLPSRTHPWVSRKQSTNRFLSSLCCPNLPSLLFLSFSLFYNLFKLNLYVDSLFQYWQLILFQSSLRTCLPLKIQFFQSLNHSSLYYLFLEFLF
ncbi:hypothetical protein ES288_A07G075800v1, partial [Gossypium darwinii]